MTRSETNYTYDSLSRLLNVSHKLSGNTIDGASYVPDPVGNRTSKTDLRTLVASNYGYDAIYQILSATQSGNPPTTTESYTFDPVGNRLSSLTVASWVYNSSNELTSTTAPGPVTTTFSYDGNGNLTSKTGGGVAASYVWDFENRLTSATLNGVTTSFKYDPFGRRIQKISPSGTRVYAYDGDNLIEELGPMGAEIAHYTQAPGIDEPLAELRSGATTFYEADGLGSVTSLSNATGAIAQTYTFDSFGNQTASSGSVTNPFRFTAREFDTETGLYYYRARYYDPTVGRFLSEDPIKFEGGIDFFVYSLNDPVAMVDPLGLKCRPSFASLWQSYPAPGTYPTKVNPPGQTSIWDLIGGKVKLNGNAGTFLNSCTVRMSYALNQSGCKIPYVKGKTVSGTNGDWYFFRLADLSDFLDSQLAPAKEYDPDHWKSSLAGQTGILQYEIQWNNATGHTSLWNGQTNVDGTAYDYSNPAVRHGAPFSGILFWPVK